MATRYFLADTNTDTACDGPGPRDLSKTQGTPTTASTGNQSSTSFVEVLTFDSDVATDSPATGVHSVSVSIASVSASTLEGRFRVQILDGSCGVLASSGYSPVFNTAGVKTLNTGSLTWGSGTRLRISFEIRKTGGGGNRNYSVDINHADTYIDAPWDASAAVGESVVLPANVLQFVAESAALPYLVRMLVGESAALLYSLREFAGENLTIPYGIGGAVGESVAAPYLVFVETGEAVSLPYNLRVLANHTLATSYSLRALAGEALAILYGIGGQAGESLLLPYELLSGLTVGKSLLSDWTIHPKYCTMGKNVLSTSLPDPDDYIPGSILFVSDAAPGQKFRGTDGVTWHILG